MKKLVVVLLVLLFLLVAIVVISMHDPPSRVAVVVNSCDAYAARTLPPLLRSLRAAGVPDADVFAVVGDCADDGYGGRVWRVRHSNMDTNGLIWAVSHQGQAALKGYDWMFYVHDTVEALPGFGANLAEVLHCRAYPGLAALKLNEGPSMSMGYYNLGALRGVAGRVAALANHDNSAEARLALKLRSEDEVFNLLAAARPGHVKWLGKPAVVDSAPNPYGTGVTRIREVWPLPGLAKYKANWRPEGLTVAL